MKVTIVSLILIACSISSFFLGRNWGNLIGEHKMIHTIKQPLLIEHNGEKGVIPKGTTLYLDKSMKEGFSRYYIYINIDPPLPHLTVTKHKNHIAPIWYSGNIFDNNK